MLPDPEPTLLSSEPIPIGIRRRSRCIATPAPTPERPVFDLNRTEQLLLWSARRWRHGRFGWDAVEAEFRAAVGARWADALLGWEEVLDLLHQRPLGQPEIRNGCATTLSADETTLLRTVALLARPGASVALLLRRLAGRCDAAAAERGLARVAAALTAEPRPQRRFSRPISRAG